MEGIGSVLATNGIHFPSYVRPEEDHLPVFAWIKIAPNLFFIYLQA